MRKEAGNDTLVHVHVKSLNSVWLFVTLWTIVHHAPLSMRFSRQEYCSGLSYPSPGDFPNPAIKLTFLESPPLADGFFTTSFQLTMIRKEAGKDTLVKTTFFVLVFMEKNDSEQKPKRLRVEQNDPWKTNYHGIAVGYKGTESMSRLEFLTAVNSQKFTVRSKKLCASGFSLPFEC